jgi:hypothetical protein
MSVFADQRKKNLARTLLLAFPVLAGGPVCAYDIFEFFPFSGDRPCCDATSWRMP